MNQLISIQQSTIAGQSISTVDARELHKQLGCTTRFNDWIRRNIETYHFIEDQDYCATQNRVADKSWLPGGNRIDYHLTLDMAKELAMVERSEKGRQIRRYFIEAENAHQHNRQAVLQMREYVLKSNPFMAQVLRYKGMGLLHVEIAKLLDCGASTVRKQVRALESFGLLAQPANLRKQQQAALRLRGTA